MHSNVDFFLWYTLKLYCDYLPDFPCLFWIRAELANLARSSSNVAFLGGDPDFFVG